MKVAPIHRALEADGRFESLILHTGQHYDEKMSDIFFRQLELPAPHIYLGVGSGSHARQTASIMTAFEEVVERERPDLVLVVGDVNSTVACSLVAAKAHIPLAHVEAGLRSGDRRMPEEINRLVTDSISDYLFATEQSALDNLKNEGVPDERVFFVGNVMIDTLVHLRKKASRSDVLNTIGVTPNGYGLLTMHRPANVDTREGIEKVVSVIRQLTERMPIVFPAHPRTLHRFESFGYGEELATMGGLHVSDPLGYLEFLKLMENSAVVVTDSGGVQEETTYLQVPCLTIRENTERPVTITMGTNQLVPLDASVVADKLDAVLASPPDSRIPPFWDGMAAERIVKHLHATSQRLAA